MGAGRVKRQWRNRRGAASVSSVGTFEAPEQVLCSRSCSFPEDTNDRENPLRSSLKNTQDKCDLTCPIILTLKATVPVQQGYEQAVSSQLRNDADT